LFNELNIGRGADLIGELLENNRALKILSLQSAKIAGQMSAKLFKGLSLNNQLKSFIISSNKLGDMGILNLSSALAVITKRTFCFIYYLEKSNA
jgi:hypothetical protein